MFEEIIEEAKDFFEDIFEHLFEEDHRKIKETPELVRRTQLAYQFTERIDSLIKIVFGFSIFISALIATVWGITAVGDMVRILVSSWPGRIVLFFVGISYLINGLWRLLHIKGK